LFHPSPFSALSACALRFRLDLPYLVLEVVHLSTNIVKLCVIVGYDESFALDLQIVNLVFQVRLGMDNLVAEVNVRSSILRA